ncbi:MAG: hypothetical protein H6818_05715 [Phycisphaerales bacterium]|nr:hypothetical protein [Phycisphaerales bacterium]
MLLLFAGVVGLVAAMPWALSRPQARETILGFVNDSIAGKVQFENVSLSWFDDLKVEGLRIADANNDEVVSAKSIYLGSGLASVARDPTRFAELRIDSPEIDLRMDEHNRPTLASAFAGKQRVTQSSPAGVESASQLPEIVGKIVITNGRVRVTPQSGQVQTVSDIEADVDIQSLNAIHGTLGFTAQGGSLMADANVDNLTREGRFDVCNASGRLKVTTKGECELGPLLAMLMPEQPVTGRGTLSIDADFKPDASSATIGAHVWDLHVVNSSNAGGAPLEMTLNGDFALAGTQLNGSVDLKGSPGEANVKLAADTAQVMPNLSTDSIMAALFGGESMALPAFSLDATSRIDLAQVERALPGVLEFQPGQAVRTGVIHVERVAVRGGKSPTVEAVAELTDASVTRNGAETRIAPMHVDLNAKVGESQGLSVDKLIVDAGFGAINASGTPRDMNVRFNGDLAAAKRDLGPFVNLGDVDVSGKVEGTLAMSRSTDDRVALDATVNTSQARLRVGEKSFDLNQTTIAQKGQLTLANNKPVRYRAEELRVNLDQQIVMSGSGSYEVESREFEADVKLDRGDLDFLAKRADMIGAPDLKRFRGQLAGNIKLHGDRDRNIETTGQLAASQLTSDGQPVLRDNLDINWKDVSYRDGGKKLQIALASLASQEATIDITNANIDLVSGDSASGKIRANADLQGVFGAVGRFSNMEKPPALKGRLNLDGDIRQSSSGLQFAAIGGVTQLEIGEGAGAVREDKVDLKLDAAIDPRQKMIRLGRNELSSGLLSAQLSGRIDQYDTDAVAKLDGEYSTQWQAITKLIEELSPGTGKLVSIHGTSRSKISLSGPLNRKGDTPPYRGATGAAAVTWDSADIVGIKLTKAQVDMKIDKGEFIIAPTTIGAAQGRVNLASRYDIASSTLRIPGRVATLEGVMFTPELSRELLSRINPVFYHVVSAEGNVELLMNNLELPLAKDAAGGGGHGKLTLKNAKIEPGGILGELIKFGIATTTGERISVALEGADFDVHDGRIHYENFAMIFPYEFDLRFRGSVGLDETVDLVVSIPVRPELLQRLGVKGPVAQYAEVLTGSRIDIPIAGTRENPKLELSKVATDGLIKEAIKRTTEKGAGDAIKGLAGGLLGGGDAKADKGGKADAGKDKGNKAGNDKPEKEKAAKGTGAKGKEKEKGKDKKKKKGIEGIIPGIGG